MANPIGTILSAAMMLRYSFNMDAEADCVEQAVAAFLDDGYRTADILPHSGEERKTFSLTGCSECGQKIVERMVRS